MAATSLASLVFIIKQSSKLSLVVQQYIKYLINVCCRNLNHPEDTAVHQILKFIYYRCSIFLLVWSFFPLLLVRFK